MRRLLGIIAAGASLAALSLFAPPAYAVDHSTTVICTGASPGNQALTTSSFAVVPGDRVTVSVVSGANPGSTFVPIAAGLSPSANVTIPPGGSFTWTVDAGFSGGSMRFNPSGCTPPAGGLTLTLTLGSSGGGGASSGAGSAPAPVVQEFGLPASGTCDAAASEDLNWAGVASGGWGVSWAQWMNGGTGGPVCTRTLFYDTTAASWAVQS